MTENQVVVFLNALHCKNIKVKSNQWVEASCPLSRWLHEKHTDNNPSFAVAIKPGGNSYFYCFVCRQGSMEELLHTIEFYSSQQAEKQEYDFLTCHKTLEEELFVVPLPEYTEFPQPTQIFEPWPDYWIESFQPVVFNAQAVSYLKSREVSVECMEKHNLRYDSYKSRIVCPYYNAFGKLAGARGRSILPDASGPNKHFDYSWQDSNNSRLCWYNEPVLNLNGPVVIVEGTFDAWKVEQTFPKVLANLTAKPTWEKMKKIDCDVIQIPDKDEAGEESVKVYAKMCYRLGIVHKVLHLDAGVKDPGEAHPLYLMNKILELL